MKCESWAEVSAKFDELIAAVDAIGQHTNLPRAGIAMAYNLYLDSARGALTNAQNIVNGQREKKDSESQGIPR